MVAPDAATCLAGDTFPRLGATMIRRVLEDAGSWYQRPPRGVRGARPSAPNTVLHPWLKEELRQILSALPEVKVREADLPALAHWAT